MISGPFALALSAGMLATVNPCGFALLPAYLSMFVGMDDGKSRASAIGRALSVSAAVTAGFVVVFAVFGAILDRIFEGLEQQLPWVTVVIGVLLVVLGIYLLMGRQLVLAIPKLQRGGGDGTLASMFLFGVSYAIASVSCTLPTFIGATSVTFRTDGFVSGLAIFVTYALGMGLVVGVLTVAVALAKDGIVQRFRALIPKVNRIAGALLLIAGAYVAYYGYYELRVFSGGDVDDPIIDAASEIQTWLQSRLPTTDTAPWYALGAAVVVGGLWLGLWSRRRNGPTDPAT